MTDDPVIDLGVVLARLSPQARLEVENVILSIQLEHARARIAELEGEND